MMKKCKRCIKAALRLVLKRNIEDIKKQIDEADVVSFDLFDTLVFRDGKTPESVFEQMDKELKKAGDYPQNKDFYKDRVGIESRLRKETAGEITIDQIYREFKWLSDAEKEKLAWKETATEIAVSRQKGAGKCLYDYAASNNRKIIITSDMYLPEEVLTKILEKNGYKGWDKLYVSGVYGVTKKNGLFKVVLKDYEGKNILHIGDDVVSDLFSAKKADVTSAVF